MKVKVRTQLPTSFLLGRSMGDAVAEERSLVVSTLIEHNLVQAANATNAQKNGSFRDFFSMRGFMLAGGLHRVRKNGGRGIDG